MRYYCPNCWKDYWNKDFRIFPDCGYDNQAHNDKDYVDKLLNALNHRSGEVRQWVVTILVMRKEKPAIPYLERLIKESKDISLVKAAKDAIVKINADT